MPENQFFHILSKLGGCFFMALTKKKLLNKVSSFWGYLVSLEERYLRTISATLNTMAWSN